MINPCVVIASHDRLQITTTNIKLLLAQGVKVILVVSDPSEREYYSNFNIEVILRPNFPLGAKWQAGIDHARKFDPSHIVVTGSDDLLSNDFFKQYCVGIDFIGFKAWYIWHEAKLHLVHYNAEQPIGGGRIYSRSLLEKMNYKLFDVRRDKLLDDYGFNHIGNRYNIFYQSEVLAIKGDWPVMNPVDLKHKNVSLINTIEGDQALSLMRRRFNYTP